MSHAVWERNEKKKGKSAGATGLGKQNIWCRWAEQEKEGMEYSKMRGETGGKTKKNWA